MTSRTRDDDAVPPKPVDLRLSRLVQPTPRRILEERVGERNSIIGELPFATDHDLPAALARVRRSLESAWATRTLHHGQAIRQAILAMSIVVLLGLAVLAVAQGSP